MNNKDQASQLSEYDKHRIIVYYNDKLNITSIAEKMNLHRHTVSKWIDRYIDNGLVGLKRVAGTGKIKPENNNQNNAIMIIHLIQNDKYLSLRQIKQKLNENDINISIYKIQNILHSHDFIYGFPPKKCPLTEETKQKRLMFAIKYKNIDWNKVFFTDEFSVWEGLKTIKRWFNNNMGIDYDVTFKHHKKLNSWIVINSSGLHNIHVFKENMNADVYVSILKDNFLNLYNSNYYMQFDNDPKHTSKKASTFIRNNNIKCLDFPSYSPDLNPIENIISVFKVNIQKRKNEISEANFKEIIIEEWNNIDNSIITNTINTMPDRLKKIIENKGNYLDY